MPNHALCVLTGHIGKDPELKYLPNNTPVLRFSIAVSTGFGEKKITTWWRCSAFGDRYAKLAAYLGKGKPVTVVGEPSGREWVGVNGVRHTDLEVRVNDIVLLGSRDDAPAHHDAAPAPQAEDAGIPF
ncbi:MAG: Single-stranded DNA-binding protein [Betaproteobacteria bacterium ADurb.Bin341]|nr:MAG: Single-stranded DNA-binding protein [Betaproteobacteria bacterium ADurb.Bin341]